MINASPVNEACYNAVHFSFKLNFFESSHLGESLQRHSHVRIHLATSGVRWNSREV